MSCYRCGGLSGDVICAVVFRSQTNIYNRTRCHMCVACLYALDVESCCFVSDQIFGPECALRRPGVGPDGNRLQLARPSLPPMRTGHEANATATI
jgi:hypothetical protein